MAKQIMTRGKTLDDIYNQLCCLEKKMDERHDAVITRLDKTNGKVKLSFWIASTAMTLVTVVIYLLFNHMGK